MFDTNGLFDFISQTYKPYKVKENQKKSVNNAKYNDTTYLHGDITADHTLDDIKKRWKDEDITRWTVNYDKPKNPISKDNHIWEKDKVRSGVERFFLLKQDIMRQIIESYGEYMGEIDYDKPKITYKSKIKDDKEDWNKDFAKALIANCYTALNGEFTIPPSLIAYLRERNAAGFIKKSKLPLTAYSVKVGQWPKAVARVREYVEDGFNEYVAMARVGQEWSEDSWANSVINTHERDGHGNPGTDGIGCGEGRIGITFRKNKYRCIKAAHLENRPNMGNCSSFESWCATYNYGIHLLNSADMRVITAVFCNMSPSGQVLLNLKTVKTELEMVMANCAAYVFKATPGLKWSQSTNPVDYINLARRAANMYVHTNGHEGFSGGIIVAYVLGKIIKGENEGNKNIQSIVDSAVKEIEGLIGELKG